VVLGSDPSATLSAIGRDLERHWQLIGPLQAHAIALYAVASSKHMK
jgi:hypothetical protein